MIFLLIYLSRLDALTVNIVVVIARNGGFSTSNYNNNYNRINLKKEEYEQFRNRLDW
jgi:hypothetical protein